jgi:hypothetical protein
LILPVDGEPRRLELQAEEPTRAIRVVHGPGHGFVGDASREGRESG